MSMRRSYVAPVDKQERWATRLTGGDTEYI